MDYKEQVIKMTKNAINEILHFARSTEADKLNWKPMDLGRSALDQLQECAQSPLFFSRVLESREFFQLDPQFLEEIKAVRAGWTTIEQCEEKMNENHEALFNTIREFPDEDLENSIKLPWGQTATMADLMMFQYWNLVYHQGQINYIQTLYGDLEMHELHKNQ